MLRLCDGFRRIDLCWDWLILPGAASAADVLPEPSLRVGTDLAPPASACQQPRASSGVPCAGEQAPCKGPWKQLSPLCNKARPRWMGLCIRACWGRAAGSAGSWEGFSQSGGTAVPCYASLGWAAVCPGMTVKTTSPHLSVRSGKRVAGEGALWEVGAWERHVALPW